MHSTLLDITAPPARDPATTWMVIAVVILAIVYVTFVRPLRQKKKDKDPLQRRPVPGALARQRAVESEMSNLLVELSEMARQMTAQLDTRAAKLELLLKEADEKILLLRAARGGGLGSGPVPSADDDSEAAASAAAALEGVIREARAPSHAAMPEPLEPRHARVYDLADEGHSPQEIARQLERPSGEIELILALRSNPHC
jgi:hypothetical protein